MPPRCWYGGAAQDPDGGIAQGGHNLGRMARANLAAIFIEGDVAHPMQAVLDTPMAPPKGGQAGGVGLIRVEAREGIPGFRVVRPCRVTTRRMVQTWATCGQSR